MELFKAIETRRSIRKFSDKEVETEKIKKILEAARLAPSWANGQCWRFIVVKDPNIKKELSQLSFVESFFAPRGYKTNPAQKGIEQAPVVIVLCADPKASGDMWNQKYYMTDVGICAQNIMLAAHGLGLGTVFVGVFYEDKVKKLLNIPDEIRVVGILPIGYPAKIPEKGPGRKDIKELAFSEKWGQTLEL